MTDVRYALIFANQETGIDSLAGALQEAGLAPLLPQHLSSNTGVISIIILDRPTANAVSISANLRKQDSFTRTPILVLLEAADQAQIAQLNSQGADLFFKPVVLKALTRYLQTKVPPSTFQSSAPSEGFEYSRSTKQANNTTEVLPINVLDLPPLVNHKTMEVVEDVIPTSNRLLPVVISPMNVAKGGVLCTHCGRWRVRHEDAFCSRCGVELAGLEVASEVVFEPFGEHRIGQLIELKNVGQNPLRMSFNLLTSSELRKRLTLHTEAASLEGSAAEHLLAVFDSHGLDLTMRYQAVLEISSNVAGFSKKQVSLIIERLPIPRITSDERYTYVLGVENRWDFLLFNDGGGTLSPSGAKLDYDETSPSPKQAELELLNPVSAKAKSGQSSTVSLQLPNLDLSPGHYVKRLTFEFEHRKPLTIDFALEVLRPARLTVQPPELDFGVISCKRSRRLSLQLVNVGGEELIIDSIVPSVDWLVSLGQTPFGIQPGNSHIVDIQATGTVEALGAFKEQIKIFSNSYDSSEQIVPFLLKFVDPLPYEDYIGIDFGTTASCVAILDKNDQPFVIQLDSIESGSTGDSRIMPSVLYFQPDGSIIAGREALKDADIQPANAVTSIKRVLGNRNKKMLAGREFDPTELTSKIIEQLVMRTEAALFQLGEYKTPRRAVVTVPVEIFDNQRRALLQACEMAGLEVHTTSKHGVVIDEAHAAALYYLSKKAQESEKTGVAERLLIFDFGGGTLDCALLEIEVIDEKVRLKTLAPGGDPRLGGEDIDWALAGLLADKTKREYPDFDVNCLSDEHRFEHHFRIPEIARAAYSTRAHFKRQAEIAKITLSQTPLVELSIGPLLRTGATPLETFIMNGLGPAQLEVEVTREELEAVIEPFLQRAISVVNTLCQRAEVSPDEVDVILHVGRTSLLSLVRERINDLLPNAVDRSSLIEPKLCVALGAAFWGQIKDQPGANFEFIGDTNQSIHDVGYIQFSTDVLRQTFVTVFPSQTVFPCEKVIEFPLVKDLITLQLVENRGKDHLIDGNPEIRRIGRVRIDARGLTGPVIPVNFAIDENRVLEISANGQSQNIELVDEER